MRFGTKRPCEALLLLLYLFPYWGYLCFKSFRQCLSVWVGRSCMVMGLQSVCYLVGATALFRKVTGFYWSVLCRISLVFVLESTRFQ